MDEAGFAGMEGIEDVVGELLALPPERFTEARNAAVKQMRADGRREAADALKRVPRPPLALWALNRLAREQPALIARFLEAAEELRQAYRSGGDVRAATAPEREAEARVNAAAIGLARAAGKNVTDAVMTSLGQTLRAAAADAGVGAALGKGLLLREPAAPSIDDLLGSLPVTPAASPAAGKPAAAARDERAAQRRALGEQVAAARSAAAETRREARAAGDEAARAHDEWQRARTHAEQLKRREDDAAETLRELEERLADV
jgi:hypothetical protein